LEDSFFDWLRNPLCKAKQFLLVGFEGDGKAVDQGDGQVTAEIQPLVLDSGR
jgi:hypothetical protein